jgi:hypothetical protein
MILSATTLASIGQKKQFTKSVITEQSTPLPRARLHHNLGKDEASNPQTVIIAD